MSTRPFASAVLTIAIAFAGMGGSARAQEEEETGNNLSMPVIWSDGVAKVLRGTFGAPVFGGEKFVLDGESYYLQQDPLNTWQAQSADAVAGGLGAIDVSWVDWGDNLEARAWKTTSVVRIETTLYQDLLTPMLGFEMAYLWGEGTTEMWGTNTTTYDSAQATVYSGVARLTIQKLTKDPSTANLQWDHINDRWVGDVLAPLFNRGVWEAGTGKPEDRYSGEINIPGKVVYGYNWNVRRTTSSLADPAGYYRITFSLDGNAPGVAQNTFFNTTQIIPPSEEELEAEIEADEDGSGGAGPGGVAVIDRIHHLTYIDVLIQASTGRKGGGGGNPISSVSLTASVPAPQPAGTSVTFTADATGGVGKTEYKFFVSESPGVWTVAQDWSQSDTFVLTYPSANSNLRVGVWARSADSTLDDVPETANSYLSIAYPMGAAQSLTVTAIHPNLPAPQTTGTTVTFTATATGGTHPYQFRWWLYDGTAWTVVQEWGSNTFVWTPATANPAYRIGVWVRSSGSASDTPETTTSYMSIPFQIQ